MQVRQLVFLAVLSSSLGAVAQCDKSNNPSLLKGDFAFRFDTSIPRQLNHAVVLRPASIVGAIRYDGNGKAQILYTGFVMLAVGNVQPLETPTMSGEYCSYPNKWGEATLTDGSGHTWYLHFIQAAQGNELVTVLWDKVNRYSVTIAQKKL
jgi:hypothetical protein